MTGRPEPSADRRSIDPTGAQLATVADLPPDQPIVMLNLLRFRETADYSTHPALAPETPISGEMAYDRYGEAATPHIAAAGADLTYLGGTHPTLIGPDGEHWDRILLVRYPSPQAFIDMVSAPEYQRLSGHRTAALADSRLVPTTPVGAA